MLTDNVEKLFRDLRSEQNFENILCPFELVLLELQSPRKNKSAEASFGWSSSMLILILVKSAKHSDSLPALGRYYLLDRQPSGSLRAKM